MSYRGRALLHVNLEQCVSEWEILEAGEKAASYVLHASRTNVLVLYNLTGIKLTPRIMASLKRLTRNSRLVRRRVIFGLPPQYRPVVDAAMRALGICSTTIITDTMEHALDCLLEDALWDDVQAEHAGGTGALISG